MSMGTSSLRRGPRHGKQVRWGSLPSYVRRRARAVINRLTSDVSQRAVADAIGVHEATISKWFAEGEPAFRFYAFIHIAETHGIDVTDAIEAARQIQDAARAARLDDDRLRVALLATLVDEHEAEAVESRGVQHFERTGDYSMLIETTAPETALQHKRIALATAAMGRGLKWRGC